MRKDRGLSEQPIEQPPAWFLLALNDALSTLESRLNRRFEERFNQIDGRLDRIDGRLDQLEIDMKLVHSRLDQLEADLKLVKAATCDRLEEERNLGRVRGAAR